MSDWVPGPRYAAYLAVREAYRGGDEQQIAEAKRRYDELWVQWHETERGKR